MSKGIIRKCFTFSVELNQKIKDELVSSNMTSNTFIANVLNDYFNKHNKKQYTKINQQTLADYLGVSKSAVSQYKKKKLDLMLLGLNEKLNKS